ncbi:MAG: hypothetical protein RRY36_08080 [Bacteroidaceae bacterium]
MPITNGIIVAPFNTWTVSKFLGMGSVGDVATVVGKSMNGGMAFDSNGRLKDGDTPYWNIFSNASPAKWVVESTNVLSLKLNSLNIPNIPAGIDYIFSDFEDYKNNTAIPEFLDGKVNTNDLGQPTGIYVKIINLEWNPNLLSDIYTHLRWAVRVYLNNSLKATILADPLDGNTLIGEFIVAGEVAGLLRDGVNLQLCIARFYDNVKYHLCSVQNTKILNTYISAKVLPTPPRPLPTITTLNFQHSEPEYMGTGITLTDNSNQTTTLKVSFKLLSWMDGSTDITLEYYNYLFEIKIQVMKHWTVGSEVLYAITEPINIQDGPNTFSYILPIAYDKVGQLYEVYIVAKKQI